MDKRLAGCLGGLTAPAYTVIKPSDVMVARD